jgi:mannose/cellobiose epimerase-like protein (N-acyl-D-glucosamine 2-epimerase family)
VPSASPSSSGNQPGCVPTRTVWCVQWWPQAETLIAALKLGRVLGDGDGHFRDFFVSLLDYVDQHFIDWTNGDWHRALSNDQVVGFKADAWKGQLNG